jgi:hypothetical protein
MEAAPPFRQVERIEVGPSPRNIAFLVERPADRAPPAWGRDAMMTAVIASDGCWRK